MRRLQRGLVQLPALGALLAAVTLAVPPAASAAPPTGATAAPAAQPALVKATGTPIVRTGPATNADQDGACNSLPNGDGDFCLWFSANFVGSLADYFNSDPNLSDNRYLTPGLGLGEVVTNNSESALNADSGLGVLVFTGANGTGAAGAIGPRAFGNFNPSFVNNVESFRFV